MKNTTKLKAILQLYTAQLDMDDEQNFRLTLIHKRTNASQTFIHKEYTRVVGYAFSYMNKNLREEVNGAEQNL